jgi:hypothetical protein
MTDSASITRKTPPPMLMVAGSATSEQEAGDRVRPYVQRFAEHDAKKTSTGRTYCGGSAAPLMPPEPDQLAIINAFVLLEA